jgi:tight adherence protein C
MDQATILKILACVFFGLATALLVVVAHWLMQDKSDAPRLAQTSMRRAEMRRRAMASSGLMRLLIPLLARMSRLTTAMGLDSLRGYVRAPYAKAGYPGGLDDDEVVSLGLLLGAVATVIIGACAGAFFGPAMVWMGMIGLPIGFLGLVSSLKSRAAERQAEILRALPYVLDLMVLILRSGTALAIALARVVEDYADHPVGDELGQVLAEINMGAPRSVAFRSFADRLDIPDITAMADSIVQSEELGWPLADTLQRLADRLTSERVLRAQATAGAAGVWVMIPSTLVLAAAVLLLFGTILVRLLKHGLMLS